MCWTSGWSIGRPTHFATSAASSSSTSCTSTSALRARAIRLAEGGGGKHRWRNPPRGRPRQTLLAPHAVAAAHDVDGVADDERLRRCRARALGGRPSGGAEQDEPLARRGRGQEAEQQEEGDHDDGALGGTPL